MNRILRDHQDAVKDCAISPDGTWCVTAAGDFFGCNVVIVWDTTTWEKRLVLQGHTQGVSACAIAPDGRWCVSGGADRSVRVWDLPAGRERLRLVGHLDGVSACAVGADGSWLVSASHDGTLVVWDASSGALLRRLEGRPGGVDCCTAVGPGPLVLSGGEDTLPKLWDVTTGALVRAYRGHTESVRGCAATRDGTRLLSSGDMDDDSVRVWDAHEGSGQVIVTGQEIGVWCCAIAAPGALGGQQGGRRDDQALGAAGGAGVGHAERSRPICHRLRDQSGRHVAVEHIAGYRLPPIAYRILATERQCAPKSVLT